MILHDKVWKIKSPPSSIVEELLKELGLSTIIAKLLINRGNDTVEKAKLFIGVRDDKFIPEPKVEKDDFSVLTIDSILDVKDISFKLIEEMNCLEFNNPKPLFIYKDITIKKVSLVGEDDNNLKLLIQDESRVYDCIGCGLSRYKDILFKDDRADIVFTLEKNSFKGVETIQLNLLDIRLKSSRIYKDREIVHKYFLSLARTIIESKTANLYNSENNDNIIDLRNSIGREKITLENLNSDKSTLVLIHTLEGLIELFFSFEDAERSDLIDLISFNNKSIDDKKGIIINPIMENIDLQNYEHIIFYDSPFNEQIFNHTLITEKKVLILYNKRDIKHFGELLDIALPNRNDLVDVYKYLRNENRNEISLIELARDSEVKNLSKLKLCIYILQDAQLIRFTEESKYIYNIDLLQMPQMKIDITDTELYKKVYSIKEKYKEFKNFAFDDSLFIFKKNRK